MTKQNEFITGKELMERWYRWDKRNFYYLAGDILKYDLTVVDRVESPDTDDSLIIGVKPEKIVQLLQNEPQTLKGRLFYFPEIEEVENKYNISVFDINRRYDFSTQGKGPTTIREAVELEDSYIKNNGNVFSLLGKIWFIKYNQKEWGLYPDHQKYKYVACLLSFSNSSKGDPLIIIKNPELTSFVKKNSLEKCKLNPEDLEGLHGDQEGIRASKGKNMNVDSKLIKLGEELVSKLIIAQASENSDSVSDAQEKFDVFKDYMSEEYGVACGISNSGNFVYRDRRKASDDFESLRSLIKGHFRNAIKDFADRMPHLTRHLQNCVKLKTLETWYRPEHPVPWYVSF
jgi:hypothetical protein